MSKRPQGGQDWGRAVRPLLFCSLGCIAREGGSRPICGRPGGSLRARIALSGSTEPPRKELSIPKSSCSFHKKAQRWETLDQSTQQTMNHHSSPPRYFFLTPPPHNPTQTQVASSASHSFQNFYLLQRLFFFDCKRLRQKSNKIFGKWERLRNTLLSWFC